MSKIEALLKTLELYIETDELVSQNFYQGLCMKAKEEIEQLQVENKQLKEAFKKYGKHHDWCVATAGTGKMDYTCSCGFAEAIDSGVKDES